MTDVVISATLVSATNSPRTPRGTYFPPHLKWRQSRVLGVGLLTQLGGVVPVRQVSAPKTNSRRWTSVSVEWHGASFLLYSFFIIISFIPRFSLALFLFTGLILPPSTHVVFSSTAIVPSSLNSLLSDLFAALWFPMEGILFPRRLHTKIFETPLWNRWRVSDYEEYIGVTMDNLIGSGSIFQWVESFQQYWEASSGNRNILESLIAHKPDIYTKTEYWSFRFWLEIVPRALFPISVVLQAQVCGFVVPQSGRL